MSKKNAHVFLEFETLENAKQFVETYKDTPAQFGTNTKYIRPQYSPYKKLIVNNQIPSLRKRLEEARQGIFFS